MLSFFVLLLLAPTMGALRNPDDDQSTQSPAPFALRSNEPEGTLRDGTISGFSVGTDIGTVLPTADVRGNAGVGPGATLGLRLGLALWDQLSIDAGVGLLLLRDLHSYTELVETCISTNAMPAPSCYPHAKQSTFRTWMLFAETGYQRRFRPSTGMSLLPGLHIGYLAGPSKLTRGVECDGCKEMTVPDMRLEGVYLAPYFRVTFGATGIAAITLRSMVFLTGKLANVTLLSYEFIAP